MKRSLTTVFIGLAITAIVAGTIVRTILCEYTKTRLERLVPSADTKMDFPVTLPANTGDLVLFFGDSRIFEWSGGNAFRGYPVFNSGIPSDTTPSMLARLENDALRFSPRWVVLAAGINDIVTGNIIGGNQGVRIQDGVLRNLRSMVGRLREQGIRVIILTITPPIEPDVVRRVVWGNGIDDKVDEVNQEIMDMVGEGVFLIDVLALFRSNTSDWTKQYIRDALHYKPAAYRLLNEAVAEIMGD